MLYVFAILERKESNPFEIDKFSFSKGLLSCLSEIEKISISQDSFLAGHKIFLKKKIQLAVLIKMASPNG